MSNTQKNDLINDLSSTDSSTKRRAILALKEFADSEIIKHVEKLFNDSDAGVRYFAKKIVKEIKDKLSSNPQSALHRDDIPLSADIEEKKSGSSTQPQNSLANNSIKITATQFNEIITGTNFEIKIKALENLFLNPDNSFLPIIISAIKSETNDKIISSMIKIIGKLGGNDDKCIKIIISYLNNSDIRIIANAIEALDIIGSIKTIPFLVPFLSSEDNRIKANSIKALSKFNRAEMINILSKMIKSQEIWMRDSAIYALGNIKCDESIELLKEILHNDNNELSNKALKALHEINSPLAMKYINEFNNKSVQQDQFVFDSVAEMFKTENNENINNTSDKLSDNNHLKEIPVKVHNVIIDSSENTEKKIKNNYIEKEAGNYANDKPINPSDVKKYYEKGVESVNKGDNQAAIELFEKALEIQLKMPNKEPHIFADTYTNIGVTWSRIGDYEKALTYYEKALEIKLIHFKEDLYVAYTYDNLGRASKEIGDHEKAIEYYKKALNIKLKYKGQEHESVAESYDNLCRTLRNKGDYENAFEYCEKALNIKLKIKGPEHESVAESYDNFGRTWEVKGHLGKAVEYYEKALNIKLKTMGQEHDSVIEGYDNLGRILVTKGDYEKAIGYYGKVLTINLKKYGEIPAVADNCINLAETLYNQGNYNKAIEYYEMAHDIKSNALGHEHLEIGRIYAAIARSLKKKFEYDKAIEYYKKYLNIMVKAHGNEHPDIAETYVTIGFTLHKKGDYSAAIEYYKKAFTIQIKFLGEEHQNVANTFDNLGSSLNYIGEYEKGIEYCERAHSIFLKLLGNNDARLIENYKNIAEIKFNQSEYIQAIELCEKAIKLINNEENINNFEIADTYLCIGKSQLKSGMKAKAIENLSKAKTIYKNLNYDGDKLIFCDDNINVNEDYKKMEAQNKLKEMGIEYDLNKLCFYIQNNKINIVSLFIDSGMLNVNEKNESGLTPLHFAVSLNSKEASLLIIQNGANVNDKANEGITPLHIAALENLNEIGVLLIEKGADVNIKSVNNNTPLHMATTEHSEEIALTLIKNKADVNAKDKDGNTPLHFAAQHNSKETALILIKNKADVKAKNNKGATPLHTASLKNSKEVALLLLKNGADINAKDNKGAIPFDYTKNPEIAQLLSVEEPPEPNLSLNEIVSNLKSVDFQLYGKNINIDINRVKYNLFRKTYDKIADDFANRYLELYKKYDNIETFSNKGLNDGFSLINEALQPALQLFVNLKIYDIDEKIFWNKYGDACLNFWSEAYHKINDQYLKIVMTSEEYNKHLTESRVNRGRWVGGGIGIEGAVKGAMKAGALNLAEGAVIGVFNLAASGINAIGDSFKKSSLYNSEDTKKTLQRGILNSVYQIHFKCCHVLNIPVPNEADITNSNTIFNNLSRINQVEEKIENLIKILKMYPYKPEFYYFCIDNFGDRNFQVEKMAKFFGIQTKNHKEVLLSEIYKTKSLDTEANALEAKQTIEKAMSDYGIKSSPILDGINDVLIKARTVDDIVFDTHEEAALARAELLFIQQLLNDEGYKKSEENAQKCLKQIKEKSSKTAVGQKYLSELVSIVNDFDKRARTVDDVIFNTRQEAEKAKSDLNSIEKIINEKNYINNEKHARECLDKLKLVKFYTELGQKYIDKFEKLIVELDIKARTVDDIVYNTRQEASVARNVKDRTVKGIVYNTLKEADKVRKDIADRTVDGYLCATINEAREINKIINIINQTDKSENKTIDKLTYILKNIEGKNYNNELLKPFLLHRLDEEGKKAVLEKIKNYQESIDAGIALNIFKVGGCFFLACIAISLLNVIGLIFVIVVLVSIYLTNKEEKRFWSFFTNNGQIKISDLKIE